QPDGTTQGEKRSRGGKGGENGEKRGGEKRGRESQEKRGRESQRKGVEREKREKRGRESQRQRVFATQDPLSLFFPFLPDPFSPSYPRLPTPFLPFILLPRVQARRSAAARRAEQSA